MVNRRRDIVAWGVVGAALATGACKAAREKEAARSVEERAAIAQSFRALSFMVPLVDPAVPRRAIDCEDATLPAHARRSGRACRGLHTVDAAYVRHLFGGGAGDAGDSESGQWMRRRAFTQLGPLDALGSRVDELKYGSALRDLERSFVGVFVDGADTTSARYRGWLVIVDVEKRRVRCQVPLDVEIASSSVNARMRSQSFFGQVDRQIDAITKNFCVE